MFVYLHGFNSSGQSFKANWLKSELSEFTWLSPSYPMQPDHAIEFLTTFLKQECPEPQKTILLGSSLGGYYAQYLARQFDMQVILINPALHPVKTLAAHLGMQTNYYTQETYRFAEPELERLKKYDVEKPCQNYVPTLVLLDKGDEVIPFQWALEKYQACADCKVFEGGNHDFLHLTESLGLIRDFANAVR